MLGSLYTERDLQFLWERQRFRGDGLLTEDARRVTVEFPGVRGGGGGPDFRAARIVIGGERRSGDVELHLVPSGWRDHGHGGDGAYAGVILHVVLRRDRFPVPAGEAPILVLEPYLLPAAPEAGVEAGGDPGAEGEAWFAERRARMRRALERAPADEVLYREILVGLGYRQNKAGMAELARRCPLGTLEGDSGAVEARLLGEAAAMPPAMWRLRDVRPANHPWRRLSGMARFVATAREEGLARGLEARSSSLGAMTAWLDPDGTGQIGRARALEIALNVFVPFLGKEAWARAAGVRPPGLPGPLRRLLGPRVSTVRDYFGALRLLRRGAFSLAARPGGC
jgi:hypothetical protein